MARASTRLLSLPLLSVLTFVGVAQPEARACGGTSCDNGPTVMPVDQTGDDFARIIPFNRGGPR